MQKKKWILLCIYRPPTQNANFVFEEKGKAIDHYSNRSENFIVLGDCTIEDTQEEITTFMEIYQVQTLIQQITCFTSDNPTCIDLILTNRPFAFQNSGTMETGLLDFHSMIVTILKGGFMKRGPRIVLYRDYSKFDKDSFRQALRDCLHEANREDVGFSEFNDSRYVDKKFENRLWTSKCFQRTGNKKCFQMSHYEQSTCYRSLAFYRGNNSTLPTFRTITVYKNL